MNQLDELDQGDFSNKIKDHCAWCNAKIYGGLARYVRQGNACDVCNGRFSKAVEGKLNQKQVEYALENRKEEVKILNL